MALRWLDDTSARIPAGVAHRATLVQPETDLFHGLRQPGLGAYFYRRRTPPGTLVTRRRLWSSRDIGTPTPCVDAVGHVLLRHVAKGGRQNDGAIQSAMHQGLTTLYPTEVLLSRTPLELS